MASLTKTEIKSRVRVLLDEIGLNESESDIELNGEEYDDAQLDTIILAKAEEALRYVYGNADEAFVPWVVSHSPMYLGVYSFDEIKESTLTFETGEGEGTPDEIYFYTPDSCFVAKINTSYYKEWSADSDGIYHDNAGSYKFKCNDDSKYYYLRSGLLIEDKSPVIAYKQTEYVANHIVATSFLDVETVWRLRAVGLSSWARILPIGEAIDTSSPDAAMLVDPYCTGTYQRPKFSANFFDGGMQVSLFSAKNASDMFIISYVEKPKYEIFPLLVPETEETENESEEATDSEEVNDESYSGLVVGERLVDAFLYYLAGLVCMVLGDERQQGLFQQAAELMGKKSETES